MYCVHVVANGIESTTDGQGSISPLSEKVRSRGKPIERQIHAEFVLDGNGAVELETGVPFLDHMLTCLQSTGVFDLKVRASGDLAVDAHHTVEDVGICLGMVLNKALGERAGIMRLWGTFAVPMDEALRDGLAVDLSNRPFPRL